MACLAVQLRVGWQAWCTLALSGAVPWRRHGHTPLMPCPSASQLAWTLHTRRVLDHSIVVGHLAAEKGHLAQVGQGTHAGHQGGVALKVAPQQAPTRLHLKPAAVLEVVAHGEA